MADSNQKYFLLTIDVEDWFQVENFKSWIPYESWPTRELRVEANTHKILDLLESVHFGPCGSAANKPKATFFVLGWIAHRLPGLVREIHARGHEVASHGYGHDLCPSIPPEDLKNDLTASKKLLEDLVGSPVTGYRAPSFSVNGKILELIQQSGYLYDSSYNSFNLNSRYGSLSSNGSKRRGIAWQIDNNFHELPISNLDVSIFQSSRPKIKNLQLPWGGGGYFRLTPFPIFRKGIKTIYEKQNAYLFYMHPWEIDPGQPRVYEASFQYRFRHYVGLEKTSSRLVRLIKSFPEASFFSCADYLEAQIDKILS